MNPNLPQSLFEILSCFALCFTAPSFRNFVVLVSGWVLSTRSHAITALVAASPAAPNPPKSLSCYHRFFSRARWSLEDLSLVLLKLLLPHLPLRVIAIVDDTLRHSCGPKIWNLDLHHDSRKSFPRHPRKSSALKSRKPGRGKRRSVFTRGHRWIILSVWLPAPWSNDKRRGFAVPLLFRHYRNQKNCPPAEFKKTTLLALELICKLRELLPKDHQLIVVVDNGYTNQTVSKGLPEGTDLIGPMLTKATLYDLPPKQWKKRGRKPVKGKRLKSIRQQMNSRNGWKTLQLKLYKRSQTIKCKRRNVVWHGVAGKRVVRMLLTKDPKGNFENRAYCCTNLKLRTSEILQIIAKRWSAEVMHRECKQLLGFEGTFNGWWKGYIGEKECEHSRFKGHTSRGRLAVERTAPFALVTRAVVLLWYVKEHRGKRDTKEVLKARLYQAQKRELSFEDILWILRREIVVARITAEASLKPHAGKIIETISSLGLVA